MNILVTGVTGMFGNAVLREIVALNTADVIKAVVRSMDKVEAHGLNMIPNVEWIVADLSQPETLNKALNGVDRAFLVTPMVSWLDKLEMNFIDAAKSNNIKKIYKLYGSVKHNKDDLIQLHKTSLNYLKNSALAWTLISPNSIIETCLMPLVGGIKQDSFIYGCTGYHKIGMVALEDVAHATAVLMTSEHPDYQEYQLTGPQALSYYDLAEIFSKVLSKDIKFKNYTESEFTNLLLGNLGKSVPEVEMKYMCHFRAWNEDGANFVTDTYANITHCIPTKVEDWLQARRQIFLS